MERTINIGGKNIPFKATGATALRYRQRTGRGFMEDVTELLAALQSPAGMSGANLDMFLIVAHIMAQQADPTIPADPEEWLDQFDMFSIYEVLPQLVELWGLSTQMLEHDDSKKKQETASAE